MKARWQRRGRRIGVRLLVALVAVAAVGWLVMSLWNWLLPGLFGWRMIGFGQALALLVLCRLLFGRLGGPWRHGGANVRARLRARWESMTPEERGKFGDQLRGRCGTAPGS